MWHSPAASHPLRPRAGAGHCAPAAMAQSTAVVPTPWPCHSHAWYAVPTPGAAPHSDHSSVPASLPTSSDVMGTPGGIQNICGGSAGCKGGPPWPPASPGSCWERGTSAAPGRFAIRCRRFPARLAGGGAAALTQRWEHAGGPPPLCSPPGAGHAAAGHGRVPKMAAG